MYCAQADLERRYSVAELIQLTDRTGADAVNADIVDEAIADADALIDSYLEKRYRDRMPFDPVPTVLERVACVIARYNLYTNHKPDEVQKPYDEVLKFLEHVAVGKVSLGADSEQPPMTGGLPQMVSDGRTFGRANSKDFI
jgi:phage gp36-like protein